jgi:hypothetical protein
MPQLVYPWIAAHLAIATILSVLVIASAPGRHGCKPRWWSVRTSIPITIACAALASAMSPELYLVQRFDGSDLMSQILFSLISYTVVVVIVRVFVAWLIIWIVALAYRVHRHRSLRLGPMQCRSCDFDQTGLPPHDLCPECGLPWTEFPSRPDPETDTLLRKASRVCLLLVVLAVLIAQSPWIIVRSHLHPLNSIVYAGETGDALGGRQVVFEIRSQDDVPYWLGIAQRAQSPRPLGGAAPLRTLLYDRSPFGLSRAAAVYAHDGLAPVDEINAFINTPPPP